MEALVDALTEPFILFIAIGLMVTAIIAFFIANAADRKGRSWAAFFWLTLLVGPIIMGIVVAAISPIDRMRPVYATPKPVNADIGSKIKELADLRDQGLLTDSEFESKKRELLERF